MDLQQPIFIPTKFLKFLTNRKGENMVLSKDELMTAIKTKFGDDTSDETITLLENISDTLDTVKEGVDWKQKFDENDKMWREKYTSRFFETPAQPTPTPNEPQPKDEEDKAEEITINDLFETK